MRSQYAKLILFFTVYLWFTTFVGAVLTPYIYSHGVDLPQLVLGKLINFISQMILLLVLTTFSSRKSWYLALISYFISLLLLVRMESPTWYYLSSIFFGFVAYFYFVFYNIAHFEHTPKQKRGISSALMFGIAPAIGIVVPLIAGYIAQINYNLIWIIAFISFLIPLALVRFQPNFSISYELKQILEEVKPVRLLIFVEGVWEAMIFAVIPVYTLFFLKTPLSYASFLSYLGIMGILANFILGGITDKLNKRYVFLYPITILLGITTFLFAFSTKNVIFWAVASGMISFLLPVFWNITTAMAVDSMRNLRIGIPGREVALVAGRIVGILCVTISFFLEKTPFFIFFFLGTVIFLYPIILLWNTRISKKYSYL